MHLSDSIVKTIQNINIAKQEKNQYCVVGFSIKNNYNFSPIDYY